MRRRQFITLFGTAVAWPLLARAENSTKRPIIAVLTAITKESNSPLTAFVQGLNEWLHCHAGLEGVEARPPPMMGGDRVFVEFLLISGPNKTFDG
jgi:hypothetical protein